MFWLQKKVVEAKILKELEKKLGVKGIGEEGQYMSRLVMMN